MLRKSMNPRRTAIRLTTLSQNRKTRAFTVSGLKALRFKAFGYRVFGSLGFMQGLRLQGCLVQGLGFRV